MAPLVAAGHHLPISITVLDQEGMDFLFGLDNLKRHQVRRRGMGGPGLLARVLTAARMLE